MTRVYIIAIVCILCMCDVKLYELIWIVGFGGALVESMPFDRKVVGSNPALAAMQRPWVTPSLAVACSALVCKLRHSVN